MYNFENVPNEDGLRVPPAGTIAVFTVTDMKQENVDTTNGAFMPKVGEKVFIKVDFSNEEHSFDERFYMLNWKAETSSHEPHVAMKRMHHLYHRITGLELGNNVTFEQMKSALMGKAVALAIDANIRETEEGIKAYSQVKYMNFARKPEEIGELSFGAQDKEKIERYKRIKEQARVERADAPTPSDPSSAPFETGTQATPDNKF